MPEFVPNKFLSKLIDIIDTLPIKQHGPANKELEESCNRLRRVLGKPPVKYSHPHKPRNATGYFDGNLSVNPPSTPAGTITTNGQFQGGRWILSANNHLRFSYPQSAFQTAFAPVTCRITGTPAPDATVTLTVNQIPVFQQYDLDLAKSDVGPNVFDLFVPAVCFTGGQNLFELVVNAGSIPMTRVQVIEATTVGDVDANIQALEFMLVRMGNENAEVTNLWPHVIASLNRHAPLQPFVKQATDLSNEFRLLKEDMRRVAMDLRTFSNNNANVYFTYFTNPKNSNADKLALAKWLHTEVEGQNTKARTTVQHLQDYKVRVQRFGEEVELVATHAMREIQAQLERIRRDLATVDLEIAYWEKTILATSGILIGSLVAGGIGLLAFVYGGPIGAVAGLIVAVVALFASAAAFGYLIYALVQFGDKQTERAKLLREKEAALAREADIKAMLSDVASIQESLEDIAAHSNGFIHMWNFLSRQMAMLLSEIEGIPEGAPDFIVGDALHLFADELVAYAKRIDRILLAYINNF